MNRDRMKDERISVLVVDDEASQTDSLVILLRREGFKSEGVYNAGEALVHLRKRNVDLVITDLKMGDNDGIWLTEQIRKNYPDIVVLVITAYGTIETAVQAIKCGAFDYILKPVQTDQLRIVLDRCLKWGTMSRKVRELENRLQMDQSRRKFLGNSPAVTRVLQMVERIAGSDSSVLICGESGTGKELIAEMIHCKSRRVDHPFVIVNCGALPETLQESELFGHARGSFTGALRDKKGLLAEADGGTLFLDEVGELSGAAQVKLLRFLENGECRRVGETTTDKLDVRVIAATNRDLAQSIEKGGFRADLFYRLNVIPISVPPLRDIKEDIPLIACAFLREYSEKMGKEPPKISEECLRILNDHHWPGNVRELRNLIERAVVVDQDGVITLGDMPDHLRLQGSELIEQGLSRKMSLKEVEKLYILSMLDECQGNRKKTGQILGITKATLWRKLNTYQGEYRNGNRPSRV